MTPPRVSAGLRASATSATRATAPTPGNDRSQSVPDFEAQHHLTIPGLSPRDGHGGVEKNTIAIDRDRLIRDGVIHDLHAVRNHGREPARLTLELRFRSKFQDLFVVKGFVRNGSLRRPRVVGGDRVALAYQGQGRRLPDDDARVLTGAHPPRR